jgi:hypothetical protein
MTGGKASYIHPILTPYSYQEIIPRITGVRRRSMVQAIISISNETNRRLNMIKARYDLRTKSEAIDKLAALYEELLPEPELRPKFVRKMLRQQGQPSIHVGTIEGLRRRYEVRAAHRSQDGQDTRSTRKE